MAYKRFVCFAARDRKRRFGGGPPPTTLSSSLSLLVYLSTSSLHPPPLFIPAASFAHSLRYVYRILPASLLVACFFLSFHLLCLSCQPRHLPLAYLPTYLYTHIYTRNTMAAAPVSSNPQTPSETPSDKQKQTNANGISSAEATANSLDNLDNPKFKDLQR